MTTITLGAAPQRGSARISSIGDAPSHDDSARGFERGSARSAERGSARAEARGIAGVITAEMAADVESRRLRRAAERHRERIVTTITIAACSVAAGTAIGFAQLLVIAR